MGKNKEVQGSLAFGITEGKAWVGGDNPWCENREVISILEISVTSEEGNLQNIIYSVISCLLKPEKDVKMFEWVCKQRCRKVHKQ